MKYTRVSETRGHIKRYVGYKDCEGYSIAIVVPGKSSGGVKQTINKIIRGLSLEGFCVKRLESRAKTILNATMFDIKNISILRELDAVIYMGSIPLPSHVFISNHVKTILFVHGFMKHELLNTILRCDKQCDLKTKAGAIYLLTLWGIFRKIDKIDLYICRSLTSCEVNAIKKDYIILPEFVFEEEIKSFKEFVKKYCSMHTDEHGGKRLRVLTYTSYANSPRLLEPHHVEHLMKIVSRQIDKVIELIVVDPRRESNIYKLSNNLVVEYRKPLPKKRFYELAMHSDLFIELNIDEELRNSTIEVGLLETPIAKLTHPVFKERIDYPEDALIHGYSFNDLAQRIIQYLKNREYYRTIYSRKFKDFVAKYRTWHNVKKPLINFLTS